LIDHKALTEVVGLPAAAKKVYAYGPGASELGARQLVLKLNRLGYQAAFIGSTGFRLADDLLPLSEGDLLVVYLPGRMLKDVEVMLDHARSAGVARVLITNSLGERLGDRVNVVLTTPTSATGPTAEALPALLVTDVLLAAAAVKESTAVDSYDLLTSLRKRLLD
jgi:DNA-binding MurR/RpiR family transcriptional regulator